MSEACGVVYNSRVQVQHVQELDDGNQYTESGTLDKLLGTGSDWANFNYLVIHRQNIPQESRDIQNNSAFGH